MTGLTIKRPGTWDERVEGEVRGYLKHLTLDKDQVWLDAGLNIGAFAVLVAPAVQRVIGYEPDPTNFAMASTNCAAYTNVTLLQAALGEPSSSRTFYLNQKKNPASHSFYVKRGRVPIQVECFDPAEVCLRAGVNCCKIDTEGSEDEILSALWPCISNIHHLVFEYHFNMGVGNRHEQYFAILEMLDREFPIVFANRKIQKHWNTTVWASRW